MSRDRPYQICTRCVMDTTDADIRFAGDGTCHHCDRQLAELENLGPLQQRKAKLRGIVDHIRAAGAKQDYDCALGVSGGVDSTYAAYFATQLGLRPLAVHLDNGWNSELAVGNIESLLRTCGIDLYTHVIDWEEFRDLQLSFLKASIPGMEIPTDHAIVATMREAATKYDVRYVISGTNAATEGIMPPSWSEVEGQYDWLLIKGIHQRFGSQPLKTFPRTSLLRTYYSKVAERNVLVRVLNYIEYDKAAVMQTLQDELGWVPYGGKHYESIYTRFTQGYIQPTKFGFDKRRAHLSNLIVSGALTRDEALAELDEPPYPDPELLRADTELFKKKLGLSDADFDAIMEAPVKSYRDYPGYSTLPRYRRLNRLALNVHFGLKKRGFYGSELTTG